MHLRAKFLIFISLIVYFLLFSFFHVYMPLDVIKSASYFLMSCLPPPIRMNGNKGQRPMPLFLFVMLYPIHLVIGSNLFCMNISLYSDSLAIIRLLCLVPAFNFPSNKGHSMVSHNIDTIISRQVSINCYALTDSLPYPILCYFKLVGVLHTRTFEWAIPSIYLLCG